LSATRHNAVGARPVLHDYGGIARQIFGEKRRDQAAGGVGATARLRADDHGDGFAAEGHGILCQSWRAGERNEKPRRHRRKRVHLVSSRC
jgi:hypothetical protein